MPLSPTCVVSDGTYLYAVAFGFQFGVKRTSDLFLARSQGHPSTIDELEWTVISRYTQGFYEKIHSYSHMCAWNPMSETVFVAVDAWPGVDDKGYIVELGKNVTYPSLQSITADVNGLENGRNVLIPPGNQSLPWIVARHNQSEILLEYLYQRPGMQIWNKGFKFHWTLGETASDVNLPLAYSSNNLYALGMKNTTPPTYTLSTIPIDASKELPTTIPTIRTVNARTFDIYDISSGDGSTTHRRGPSDSKSELRHWIPVPNLLDSPAWSFAALADDKTYGPSLRDGTDTWGKSKWFVVDQGYISEDEYMKSLDDRGMSKGKIAIIVVACVVVMGIILFLCRRHRRAKVNAIPKEEDLELNSMERSVRPEVVSSMEPSVRPEVVSSMEPSVRRQVVSSMEPSANLEVKGANDSSRHSTEGQAAASPETRV
ncbi:hypothetical protein BGX31_007313 [Mortierella sp. GBA43]|nr:hypothetical protein BGX31_007313 [Mortierella sp. GBA43]